MNAKLALTITAALAVLILIPVLVVVGLGVYGSALGGSTRVTGSSGAELTLQPARGPSGSVVTIRGSNWPERKNVSLFLRRPAVTDAGAQLRLRLAKVLTSRSGTFQIESVVPSALVGADTNEIFIEGLSEVDGRGASADVRFEVLPHPGSIKVSVASAASGDYLTNAVVSLMDNFGQRLGRAVTDEDGNVVFSGLGPGSRRVRVRHVDHQPEHVRFRADGAGEIAVNIELQPSPIRRLYLASPQPATDARIRVRGIDRASGLAFDERISTPPNEVAAIGSLFRNRGFDYLLVTHSTAARPIGFAESLRSLWAMGEIGLSTDLLSPGHAIGITHVGTTGNGELVYVSQTAFRAVPGASISLFDPETSTVLFSRRIDANTLLPFLSRDRSQILVIDWSRRRLQILDAITGEEIADYFGVLPYFVHYAVHDPANDALLMITADTGELYRFGLSDRTLSEPILELKGATSMTVTPDGTALLAIPSESVIAVASLEDGFIEATIPLSNPADWVWADPDGPFVYAGRTSRSGRVFVHVLDESTLQVIDYLEISDTAESS